MTHHRLASTSRARQPRLRPLVLALALAGAVGTVAPAWAAAPTIATDQLPENMKLVRGEATLNATSGTNGGVSLQAIQTSDKAVWETTNFSVGEI